ncbi:hypothetical protein GCM10010478_51060 [Streptomyces erythrogriseus]|uniref:Uncharacterized protein n=2 Tax=Streptomyces TaxID=1883 RepID=A0ABN3XB44_9ACTN
MSTRPDRNRADPADLHTCQLGQNEPWLHHTLALNACGLLLTCGEAPPASLRQGRHRRHRRRHRRRHGCQSRGDHLDLRPTHDIHALIDAQDVKPAPVIRTV